MEHENSIENLYTEAEKLVIREHKSSAGFLQRKLKIGYAMSALLIDMLEEKGIVGPADGTKPRKILKTEK